MKSLRSYLCLFPYDIAVDVSGNVLATGYVLGPDICLYEVAAE